MEIKMVDINTLTPYEKNPRVTNMNHKRYEEHYLVYEDGKIFSEKINRFQKPRVHSNGYLRCTINGKDKYIHRLVAECFLHKDDGLYEINHKDGIKTNNNADNLEWSDRAKNCQHCFDIGLRTSIQMREISLCDAAVEGRKKRRSFNDKQVKDILLLMKTGVGDTFISKRYCISRGAIYAIRAKKTYKEYER